MKNQKPYIIPQALCLVISGLAPYYANDFSTTINNMIDTNEDALNANIEIDQQNDALQSAWLNLLPQISLDSLSAQIDYVTGFTTNMYPYIEVDFTLFSMDNFSQIFSSQLSKKEATLKYKKTYQKILIDSVEIYLNALVALNTMKVYMEEMKWLESYEEKHFSKNTKSAQMIAKELKTLKATSQEKYNETKHLFDKTIVSLSKETNTPIVEIENWLEKIHIQAFEISIENDKVKAKDVDIQLAEIAVEQAELALSKQYSQFYPSISGSITYDTSQGSFQNSFDAQAQFSIGGINILPNTPTTFASYRKSILKAKNKLRQAHKQALINQDHIAIELKHIDSTIKKNALILSDLQKNLDEAEEELQNIQDDDNKLQHLNQLILRNYENIKTNKLNNINHKKRALMLQTQKDQSIIKTRENFKNKNQ